MCGEVKMVTYGRGLWGVSAIICLVSADASGVLSREWAPLQPYGTDAQVRQCVADMQASLHGRSILGSRDTASYIQSRGFLDDRVGVTEYDLLVSRCLGGVYRRYADQSPRRRTETAKRRR